MSTTRVRTCSHCKLPGHNIQTCPNMSPEDKQRRREEKAARNLRLQRLRQMREQNRLNSISNVERPGTHKQRVLIENLNNYPVCVFWAFTETSLSHNWEMFSIVIPEYGLTYLKFSRDHNLKVVPLEEIQSDHPPQDCEGLFEVCQLNGPNFFDTTTPVDNGLEDSKYTYRIEKKEYKPVLDPLTMWRNASLKSMFLLRELIRLGAKNNETYDIILDMVQDIELPTFTEMDKEQAGVPSAFTNVT